MKAYFLMVGLAAAAMLTGSGMSGVRPQDGPTLRIPDGQSLLLSARAEGVQIYTAKPKAGSATTFEWVLKAPRAILFDQDHKKIGTHSGGPTWELNNGSKVVGVQPPKQRVDAANPKDVAWLLLEAKSHEGTGPLSKVTFIMRVDTAGGVPHSVPPTKEGQETQVKYRATYVFLCASPNGAPSMVLRSPDKGALASAAKAGWTVIELRQGKLYQSSHATAGR
ncbi:MAG: DUF3455 domain-containing protein [Armatimonadetes bacterium]|nr:DUF3455 domain-containing protein [Armatimonadota bacterium]